MDSRFRGNDWIIFENQQDIPGGRSAAAFLGTFLCRRYPFFSSWSSLKAVKIGGEQVWPRQR
jgi:hypothetical protein